MKKLRRIQAKHIVSAIFIFTVVLFLYIIPLDEKYEYGNYVIHNKTDNTHKLELFFIDDEELKRETITVEPGNVFAEKRTVYNTRNSFSFIHFVNEEEQVFLSEEGRFRSMDIFLCGEPTAMFILHSKLSSDPDPC